MSDYIVRATAGNGAIRAFAIYSKDIVETARQAHNTSPVATAALGRLLTAGSMMGVMMKGEKDVLTLQIRGTGPIEGLLVTANSKGQVKGYPFNPDVVIPANSIGKLDVAGAIGEGILSVIKDLGMKEPYVGQTDLQTSEIAEDLTYYFATSEQIPSAVGLGVLMNRDNTVRQAGGFIIQLMPFVPEETVTQLEDRLATITSVTSMLDKGMTPEMILQMILQEFDVEIYERIPVEFHCDCSKEKVSKAIVSIGSKDIRSLIQEGKPVECGCSFCGKNYLFSIEDMKELLRQAKR